MHCVLFCSVMVILSILSWFIWSFHPYSSESYDCPSANEVNLRDIGKNFQSQITTKCNKAALCIILGCTLYVILIYEHFSLQPAHPCFKIDHVGSSWKFPYMFPVYMVITSENKKIIWKVVFKILTYFAKIRALFRHLFGRNADIW